MRLILVLAAALCLGAAPAKPPPAKADPAKPAPAVSAVAPTDPQNPQTTVALLATMGAKATVGERTEDGVYFKVETPHYGFAGQFAGCDKQGRKCRAVAFTTEAQNSPTLAELNAFNQTSLTCRVWQDKAGKPHLMYSALLSPTDTTAVLQTHFGAWQGCLAEFGDFLKDPKAYLASAP
jgi:hypothetical protein